MLLPIIMICVCALLGGGTLIFLKLSAKHKKSKNKDKEELAQITANEFVNVKDMCIWRIPASMLRSRFWKV